MTSHQQATLDEILTYTDTCELLSDDELTRVETILYKETQRARKPPNMPSLPNLSAHDRLAIARHERGRRAFHNWAVDTGVDNRTVVHSPADGPTV